MSKNKKVLYNEPNMKTLDATALRKKKAELDMQFEQIKKQAVSYENIIAKIGKKREECLEKMSQLQGSYRTITDLEKSIGIKPDLSANKGLESPAKK